MTGGEETSAQGGGAEDRLTRIGAVTYMQIPATDVRASAAFYENVFGWTAQDRGSDSHLSFEDAATHMVGAFVTGRAIAGEPGILPYVYVDGVDAAIERVKAAGGQVVREPYPEGGLWVATVRDVAGNVIGVWRAGSR
jgi:predicted enzyme related to lactoylglutathione lyase